jgi:hypothetical protein
MYGWHGPSKPACGAFATGYSGAPSHTDAMAKTVPEFEPQMMNSGRWCVSVRPEMFRTLISETSRPKQKPKPGFRPKLNTAWQARCKKVIPVCKSGGACRSRRRAFLSPRRLERSFAPTNVARNECARRVGNHRPHGMISHALCTRRALHLRLRLDGMCSD